MGAVAALGLPQSKGEQVGVNAPAAGRARRLAVWRVQIEETDANVGAAGGAPAGMTSVVAVFDRR